MATSTTAPAVSTEKDLYSIARVAHEANRAHCENLRDFSQQRWEEAPEWQRQSALAGVETLAKDPSLTPADLHQRWCEHKIADGWKYGAVKDAEAKTHPCLVLYEQLPKSQQVKDHLFRAVVLALLEK